MARILALLADPTARARLRGALKEERSTGATHELLIAASAAQLEAWCAQGDAHALIFDPFASGVPDAEFWGALRRRHPSLALLVYADLARRAREHHAWLAKTGIREIVLLNEEDSPTGLRERLMRGLLLSLYAITWPEVRERFPAHLHSYAERLLREAHRSLTTAEAVALGYRSERTLRRELESAGLPPLHQLVGWFRLLHAAHLLDDPGRTVGNVARVLEFASENALRNQLRRYTGCGPGELRRGRARGRRSGRGAGSRGGRSGEVGKKCGGDRMVLAGNVWFWQGACGRGLQRMRIIRIGSRIVTVHRVRVSGVERA